MALFDYIVESIICEKTNTNKEKEKYIKSKLTPLVPRANAFDVRVNVSDSSYSVEFFATINGKKYQCYDLVEIGLIDEKKLDDTFKNIANYIRTCSDYKDGKVNKYTFHIG